MKQSSRKSPSYKNNRPNDITDDHLIKSSINKPSSNRENNNSLRTSEVPNLETFYKEENFFITKSIINKNTHININKIFFPEKYKKKPLNITIKNFDYPNENNNNNYKNSKVTIETNSNIKTDVKASKKKLLPIKNRTIFSKKEFPPIKNNFTISLNNELSRISLVYGKEDSFKKFTENPISNQYFDQRNFLHYEVSKINEITDGNTRPKLKPLVLIREPTMQKLSESIFHIKELEGIGHINDLVDFA